MKELGQRYYKIDEVAAKWKKPIDHVWRIAAEGKIQLMTWYDGYFLKESESERETGLKKDTLNQYEKFSYCNDFVGIYSVAALEFSSPHNVDYILAGQLIINGEKKIPAREAGEHGTISCSAFKVYRDTVIVSAAEVIRLEEKYPELLGKVPCKEIAPENKKLHLSERKSVYMMLYAMAVSGYGWDPTAGKSVITAQIVEDVAKADMKIDVDTVRKYLKAARKYKEEFF